MYLTSQLVINDNYMPNFGVKRFVFSVVLVIFASLIASPAINAQSKPQKTERPTGEGKKNTRPSPEELKKAEEEKKRLEEEKNAVFDPTIEKIETNIVNVDAVVYNKKTGQIITGLKKENFAIFENGVKKDISNFATPESPITVTLVVEYSRWSELFGRAAGGYFEPGTYEVLRPVADFLTRFIKPPNDYASVIAFDLRPTTITDFTNDPRRIQDTITLLLQNRPAFTDSNLYDAVKFALRRRQRRCRRVGKIKKGNCRIRRHGQREIKAKGDHSRRFGDKYFRREHLRRNSPHRPGSRNSTLYHQHGKSFLQKILRLPRPVECEAGRT